MIDRFFMALLAALCVSPSLSQAASLDGSGVNQLFKAPTLIASSADGFQSAHLAPEGSVFVAQAEGDDAYDPFADYSEFEQSMDEEEDVNFFRNGRLLTLGFIGGYRGFTQNLGKYYSGNANFGLFLAYFFDLNFALQLGYVTSDHTLVIPATPAGTSAIQGTVSISDISVLLKYYLNTQNVTRGLASLSPYIVGGFSQIYRTTTVSGQDEFARDSAFGFNVGGGLEVPMMRNKMYFGIQGMYQVISFADESKIVLDENDNQTGAALSGDAFLVQGVLGINF
jgi:hypothetical protein